jgi:hypothetical protein
MNSGNHWPTLNYESWKDTLDTLHMKMQIIGKVKLALNPFLNQWWQVTFHLNLKGMTTSLIPYKDGIFEIEFNFLDHNLSISTSGNNSAIINLYDSSVAEFYHEFMEAMTSLGISVKINTMPCEFIDPVPFELDHGKNSYDKEFVQRWWRILLKIQPVFERFRTGFRSKSSPVHFFWGSFDLSESRFSGKPCQYPQGGGRIMKFAENEENFTFGFWPGDKNFPHPAFYSYFYPAPAGIESLNYFSPYMKEFILDYQEVINTPDPEETILNFLSETYDEGAALAGWDVKSLRAEIPSEYKIFSFRIG